MLRLADVKRLVGRRRLNNLLACGWLRPIALSQFGKGGAVYFDERDVRVAIERVAREGYVPQRHHERKPHPRRPLVNLAEIEIDEP